MTDEEIRVWIAFALLDGIAAWTEIYFYQMTELEALGYITVKASGQHGKNEMLVTNMGKQFLKEYKHENV